MGTTRVQQVLSTAVLAVVLACAGGCGGGDDDDSGADGGGGGGAGSCSVEPAATCIDYTGSIWTATSAEDNCKEMPSSTYSSSSCPSSDRVGSCAHAQGGDGEFVTHYYGPTFTAATAESACLSSGGVWIS